MILLRYAMAAFATMNKEDEAMVTQPERICALVEYAMPCLLIFDERRDALMLRHQD